jgi:hypothetical protein
MYLFHLMEATLLCIPAQREQPSTSNQCNQHIRLSMDHGRFLDEF